MHYFENFKGFAKAQLNLSRPLTVLIGPNGSGKTNAIEAVELLSFLVSGGSLSDVTDVNRGRTGLEIRGGLRGCARFGHDEFTLRWTGIWSFDKCDLAVTVRVAPAAGISHEKLGLADQGVLYEHGGSPVATTGKKTIEPSDQTMLLARYSGVSEHDYRQAYQINSLIESLKVVLRPPAIVEPDPEHMRGYEPHGQRFLTRNCSNLSSVLEYQLLSPEQNREFTEIFDRLFGDTYEPPLFEETGLNDVILKLKEKATGKFVDARLLSDGTLRALAVLTAVETVYSGSTVIIEEFDNGLHPSRVKALVETLEDCCERRSLSALVTTHNPATLNALSRDQLDGVVLCTWDKREEAFNLIELSDMDYLPEILERGKLGDLVTRGVIEQYLEPDFHEKRSKRALQWLESLSE